MRVKERKLELLKSACNNQANMFERHNQYEKTTLTSYITSHLLGNVKSILDGEITKQVIVMFTKNCCFANI